MPICHSHYLQLGRERELEIIRNVIQATSMEHSHALQSSGPIIQHYRSSSTAPYRVSGMHAAGSGSSTSLLGQTISKHSTAEMGLGDDVAAHANASFVESPIGGDGSATNGSTWASNTYGGDGDATPLTLGSVHPPSGDAPSLSIHRNVDSVRRGSGLKHSPASSVLQSPTIQNAMGIGGPGSVSLSHSVASSTAPSGASGLSYPHRGKSAMARSVVVCGPAGIGKSSLILANQTNWRSSGLWGYAKMVQGESSPFTGLVRHCFPLLAL